MIPEQFNQSENGEAMSEKQKLWEEKMEEVEKITDVIGKEVDPGVKETVAILQLMNINTSASCEGHLDEEEGMPAPYINIESPKSRELSVKREELFSKQDTLEEGTEEYEQIAAEIDQNSIDSLNFLRS